VSFSNKAEKVQARQRAHLLVLQHRGGQRPP